MNTLLDTRLLTLELNELHADLCAALADPRRILILYLLANSPLTVNELAALVEISQPAASRHLKILRAAGLVIATRQGASVSYSLADMRLIQALDLLRAVLKDRLSRNASLVEEEIETE